MDTIFLVSSSDNTYDVFEIVGKRLAQMMPMGKYDLYVGLNNKNAFIPYKVLRARPAGWSKELLEQISQLPESITKIVLILDDFWFYDPLPLDIMVELLKKFDNLNADYLRLVPLKRSAIPSFFRSRLFLRIFTQDDIERIGPGEPYYSSLQVAVWRRDYLQKILIKTKSIWNFEHEYIEDSRHFAVTKNLLKYEHLVEKGRWYPFALPIITDFVGNKNIKRPINISYGWLRINFARIKFSIFGYSFFRFKRIISKNIIK